MFTRIMQDYFRGERIEALAFIVPLAIILLVLAAVALRSVGGQFGVGLAAPLGLFAVVAAATGLTVGLRAPGQVAAIESELAASPRAMVEKELPRMRRVNANWPAYVAGYAVLILAGAGLRFAVARDWAHGLGSALILVAALGLLVDGFAERRARPYTAALEALAAEHGVVAK